MSSNSEGIFGLMGCLLIILTLIYGLFQFHIGYICIEHHLGSGWAIAAIILAFMLRFTLPITIGAFFGAMDVWGWHWAVALLFAAPGLAFMALMIPGIFASSLAKIKR